MPAIVATEHRFIRTIRIAIIAGKFLRLKGLGERTRSIRTIRIGFNSADSIPIYITHALALRHRVFVHPEDSALLYRQQVVPGIDIAPLPNSRAVHFSN